VITGRITTKKAKDVSLLKNPKKEEELRFGRSVSHPREKPRAKKEKCALQTETSILN